MYHISPIESYNIRGLAYSLEPNERYDIIIMGEEWYIFV